MLLVLRSWSLWSSAMSVATHVSGYGDALTTSQKSPVDRCLWVFGEMLLICLSFYSLAPLWTFKEFSYLSRLCKQMLRYLIRKTFIAEQ